MGYDAGIQSNDPSVRGIVADAYRDMGEGWEFDASWAIDHGGLYNFRGWEMTELCRDIESHATGRQMVSDDDGEYELSVIPVSVLLEYTDAFDAFCETLAGKKLYAAWELGYEWYVGDFPKGWQPGQSIVIVDVLDMLEAKKALSKTGHGEVLYDLLDSSDGFWQLKGFSRIVGVLKDNDVGEVLWYESY